MSSLRLAAAFTGSTYRSGRKDVGMFVATGAVVGTGVGAWGVVGACDSKIPAMGSSSVPTLDGRTSRCLGMGLRGDQFEISAAGSCSIVLEHGSLTREKPVQSTRCD
jgi:hypothetical protein